jgi:Winged helix DNA-binding domain
MLRVPDEERRRRLAVRHALAPSHRVTSPVAATEAMTVLHATEAATVYLSCWARSHSLTIAHVERALHDERSIVKQLAMRRTVFVFPRDLLAAAWPSASARVARSERAQMARDIVAAGIASDGDAWLDRARADVLSVLAGVPDGLTAAEVRRAAPVIDVKVSVRAGSAWASPRVLTQLGATADIARGTNTGHWRVSRPRWTLMRHWLGDVPAQWAEADGWRELVRRWLFTFGPGTEDDIVWWLGATKGIVRAALADLEAVPVILDSTATGWLLPDDLEETPDPGPWVALLPVLDPTVMGWKERGFSLGPHREQLFDRAGNAGTTAWVDGRIVGCWVQDEDGAVSVRLLERVPASAQEALDHEAQRLTTWLDGERVNSVIRPPAMQAADQREKTART